MVGFLPTGGIDINERVKNKSLLKTLWSTTVGTRSFLCIGIKIAVDILVACEQIFLIVHVWQLQQMFPFLHSRIGEVIIWVQI